MGAYLPDVIDKSLSILFHLPARGVGHSFLVILPLIGLSFWVFRNRLPALNSLQLGVLLHLVGDLEEYNELWWPFMYDVDFPNGFSFSFVLYHYYILQDRPISLATEVGCALVCIYLLVYERIWVYYVGQSAEVRRDEAGS